MNKLQASILRGSVQIWRGFVLCGKLYSAFIVFARLKWVRLTWDESEGASVHFRCFCNAFRYNTRLGSSRTWISRRGLEGESLGDLHEYLVCNGHVLSSARDLLWQCDVSNCPSARVHCLMVNWFTVNVATDTRSGLYGFTVDASLQRRPVRDISSNEILLCESDSVKGCINWVGFLYRVWHPTMKGIHSIPDSKAAAEPRMASHLALAVSLSTPVLCDSPRDFSSKGTRSPTTAGSMRAGLCGPSLDFPSTQ